MTSLTPPCPPANEVPIFNGLSIPANITTVFTPGSNTTDTAMVNCCAPNTVHVSMGCYQWCEVPKDGRLGSSQSDIQDRFGVCLGANGRNGTIIIGAHVASRASGQATSWSLLGLCALLISGSWVVNEFL
ncbi:hypothetical protein QBC34DRAFT_413278 [Podospora aff. communis PSN243]|uniref:Uncharacterized protein n=1 Tax=Podospora aff. communis PSN243 TaxID=3040156 RepID=A0AAV9GAQ2_9PEZI|nr:hypothetical protein QBC34DRAFT_413278 [Podospora aff. communis PSN243]